MTSKSEEKILRSIETFFCPTLISLIRESFLGKKYKYVRTNLVLGYSPVTRQKHEMGLLHLGEQTKLDALTRHRTISSAARDFA